MENSLDFLYDIDYVETHLFRFCVATEYESHKLVRIEVYKNDTPIFLWYPNTPSSLFGFKHKITRAEYDYCCQIFANCIDSSIEDVKLKFKYE